MALQPMPVERFAWPTDVSGSQIVVQLPRGAEFERQHRILLAFCGQGCRITITPDDENELRSPTALERGVVDRGPVSPASCLLVYSQEEDLSRVELRAAIRLAMAQAAISSGADSLSLGASGPYSNVSLDSFASRFESVSRGNSANSVRMAGRALLLGAAGGVYDAVLVGADEVDAWRSAMKESADYSGLGLVLLDGVVPEGGAACAPKFTVWIAAGRKGRDQVYKQIRIYAEEAAPTPKPPPAGGLSEGMAMGAADG